MILYVFVKRFLEYIEIYTLVQIQNLVDVMVCRRFSTIVAFGDQPYAAGVRHFYLLRSFSFGDQPYACRPTFCSCWYNLLRSRQDYELQYDVEIE
jgi:hypothetical protein